MLMSANKIERFIMSLFKDKNTETKEKTETKLTPREQFVTILSKRIL